MGLRSKMLAIVAWGFFLFGQLDVSQSLNINSSVIPLGFSSSVTVELAYQAGEELLPPLCGNNIRLARSNITVDLNSPERQLVPAAKLQTPPRVVVTGLSDSDSYTYVFADVSALQAFFGTRDKPLIYEMRVNVAGSDFNSGIVLDPYLAPIPEWGYTAEVHIFIFRQPSVLSNYSLEEYVNTACGVGLRCAFDIRKFVEDKQLSLVYAGGFEVSQDEASIVAVSALVGEVFACNRLVLYRLEQNPLIRDAELKVSIEARFKTEEVVTKPLCGRVFHYMDDDLVVASRNSKAIPTRKLRSVPSISLEMKSLPIRPGQETSQQNFSASGNRTADQQDVLFTLVLVQHVDGADMERPLVNWVITNIKNFEISTGDCSVPYQAMLPSEGKRNANFLLYKQSRRIEIQAGDYARDGYCPLLFRCGWDMKKLVEENDLELVGALSYFVEADPYSVTEMVEAKEIDANVGCTRLAEYKHEGRMLGQCLSKFDAWKALKQELEKCVVEFKKQMIMKKMSMMCPELGSHFSEEKKKWEEERKEEKMGEYGVMGDTEKEEMEKMVKMFMMKEMWKKKGMGEKEDGKIREMWENIMKRQQERKEAMDQWEGKMGKDDGNPIVQWIRDVKQKIMKETLMNVFEEFFASDKDREKSSSEEFKAKWNRFQNWGQKADEDEENKEKQKLFMEIKKKIMMEKMKKVMAMLKEEQKMDQWKEKLAIWKNLEEKERKEREKEGMIQEIKKKMMMKVFQLLLEHGDKKEENRDEELKEMKEKVMGFVKMMVMAKKEFEDKMEEMKKKIMMMKLFDKLLSGGVDEEECSKDEKIREMKEKVLKMFKMRMGEDEENPEKMQILEMIKKFKMIKDGDDSGFEREGNKNEKHKKFFELVKKFGKLEEGREGSFENDQKKAEKIKKLFEIFQIVKGEKEGKEGGFGKDEGEGEKMKKIFEMIKIFKMMKEEKEGSFEEGGEKGEKMKKIFEIFKFFKEEEEEGRDGRREKDGQEEEKMKKIFQILKMLEFAKKWDEDVDALEQEDKKAKKMAFLVHAFKAFLTKHMAMKEKLEMFEEFFKKKMMMEKRCPLTDEDTGEDYEKYEAKSKCMMLLKEMKMKEKIKEILEDNMSDMKDKGGFFKEMMATVMNRAKDEM